MVHRKGGSQVAGTEGLPRPRQEALGRSSSLGEKTVVMAQLAALPRGGSGLVGSCSAGFQPAVLLFGPSRLTTFRSFLLDNEIRVEFAATHSKQTIGAPATRQFFGGGLRNRFLSFQPVVFAVTHRKQTMRGQNKCQQFAMAQTGLLAGRNYKSRRPSMALSIVTSSAYSRSEPTGMPIAMRVTRTPSGLISFER